DTVGGAPADQNPPRPAAGLNRASGPLCAAGRAPPDTADSPYNCLVDRVCDTCFGPAAGRGGF
ncbi:MAG: hypothetical protein AB7Q17_14305, partial [Phycisphaerae bacterium]